MFFILAFILCNSELWQPTLTLRNPQLAPPQSHCLSKPRKTKELFKMTTKLHQLSKARCHLRKMPNQMASLKANQLQAPSLLPSLQRMLQAPSQIMESPMNSKKKEFFDAKEVLADKIEQLARWIRESRYCIVFTGAGISTSTGIPDFRSGMNTVLPTGPGVWERKAQGVLLPSQQKKTQSILKAVPSPSHMAIVKMQEEGLVKFVISQNTDGLHRRSGLDPNLLAELHGNTNMEKCLKCGLEYMRDFRTRTARAVHNHLTGRRCDNPKCGGPLVDSIINFNEDLPEEELQKGFENGKLADLCIVLGSSLRVYPAADIPGDMIKRGARVVIVNLQKTPLNKKCAMEVHAKIDTLILGVMQQLGLTIPSFKLQRCFAVDVKSDSLTIQGLDPSTKRILTPSLKVLRLI